jgi:hypothetical protein
VDVACATARGVLPASYPRRKEKGGPPEYLRAAKESKSDPKRMDSKPMCWTVEPEHPTLDVSASDCWTSTESPPHAAVYIICGVSLRALRSPKAIRDALVLQRRVAEHCRAVGGASLGKREERRAPTTRSLVKAGQARQGKARKIPCKLAASGLSPSRNSQVLFASSSSKSRIQLPVHRQRENLSAAHALCGTVTFSVSCVDGGRAPSSGDKVGCRVGIPSWSPSFSGVREKKGPLH